VKFDFTSNKDIFSSELILFSAFNKQSKLDISHWPSDIAKVFYNIKSSFLYNGKMSETFFFNLTSGTTVMIYGLGEKEKLNWETLRKEMAKTYKAIKLTNSSVTIDIAQFAIKKQFDKTIQTICESFLLTAYEFNKYKTLNKDKTPTKLEIINFHLPPKSGLRPANLKSLITNTETIVSAINFSRDLSNEAPNILHSENFAKIIAEDAKLLKKVKIKVLTQKEIEKEKMNLFLAVNAASQYEARLVELSYTPSKVTKNTKHIVLVGKGLTFDTGGLCLKPASSIENMKYDMTGAATMYAAFKACCFLNVKTKVTCLLGMTDNTISASATLPDAIIKSRKGTTVEILNTDAEGRLVLADLLDYACEMHPNYVIDCATLTGAILVALGPEICGLFGNNDKLISDITKSAKNCNEYIWHMPIIEEFKSDLKSNCADLRNLGTSRNGGASKAAAFLEHFIKNDVAWAHLDIAGVAGSQSHLPYCPSKGASGLMIRTLIDFISGHA